MIFRFNPIEKILLRLNILPHPILDSLTSVMAGRALQMAVKLGIFDNVDRVQAKTVKEIASNCGLSENGTLVLVDCLAALGYLEKADQDRYLFSKRGERFFGRESPFSMRNVVLFDANFAFPRLAHLEEHIRQGQAISVDPNILSQQDWEIFNAAMIDLAKRNMEEITKAVPLDQNHKRLLDVGGMHGLYAIEYCKHYPDLSAEVIDLAPAKVFADRAIAEHQMQERVRFRVRDFLKESLGEQNDVAIAVNIIHTLTFNDNQLLTEKVFKSLNPGGRIVIVDQIKHIASKSELSQLFVAALGLMLFNHSGGRTYSFDEVKNWLTKAGFKQIKLKKMKTPGFGIIQAEK